MSADDLVDVFDRGAAHVWWGTAAAPSALSATAVLSAAEGEWARAMTAEAGLRYTAAQVAVRRILAGYLGTDPALVLLGRLRCPQCAGDDHGAPCVVWPPTELSYSLSRSGPHWILGVTGGRRRIGIGIEEMSPVDLDAVAPTVLSMRELSRLRAQPASEGQLGLFLRYWTRKEAVINASGVGPMTDLRAVDVHDAPLGDPLVVRHAAATGPDSWVVEDIAVGPGRYAAIARETAATGPLRLIGNTHPALDLPVPEPVPAGRTEMLETRSTPWPSAISSLSTTSPTPI
ncbi:4'-phosphopantetheinyl transferase family protein [Streptomyces sp. NPDC048516]|uniref:4'-phosphopantetheinyl transferase family protein n=1 Tax=Streptomyces sp. NPDC048516 TaxID=3365565 RepID=UPI00371F25BA